MTRQPTHDERDWLEWHRQYDDPASRLARRLRVVQGHIRGALDARDSHTRLISICAGQGRDVLPVLAEHRRRDDVDALLVELDARNAKLAEAAALSARLERVRVLRADASLTDSYAGSVPADVVLACGVFGNISDADIELTIEHLPCMCAENATVVWTRGERRRAGVTSAIRQWFAESGFEELAFDAPDEETFRVGVHRLIGPPRPLERGVRLFRFL